MQLETKFLRLPKPVKSGEEIDGWRVCWLGGWGKGRIFFFVMVVRETGAAQRKFALRRSGGRARIRLFGDLRPKPIGLVIDEWGVWDSDSKFEEGFRQNAPASQF